MLTCFISCIASAAFCSVYSLDVENEMNDASVVFFFHFITSCASVNATGVTVNSNKAPDGLLEFVLVTGCFSAVGKG